MQRDMYIFQQSTAAMKRSYAQFFGSVSSANEDEGAEA